MCKKHFAVIALLILISFSQNAFATPLTRARETAVQYELFDVVDDALDDTPRNMFAHAYTLNKTAKVWVTGMYNHADKKTTSGSSGFDVDTNGMAMGVDGKIGSDTRIGVGYSYNKSDIDGYALDADAKTHTAFVYGKYMPERWYVDVQALYSWSDYDEKESMLGARAKYDVDTVALQGMYGYELLFDRGHTAITPEAGLRYLHIDQDNYTNRSGVFVWNKDVEVLTAVFGGKAAQRILLGQDMMLRPELRAALTYDILSDGTRSVVVLPNHVLYRLRGEQLNRVGYELGARIVLDMSAAWELAAGYEARLRNQYQDHTGIMSVKYRF